MAIRKRYSSSSCFTRTWWAIKWHTHLITISARGDGDEIVCHFSVVTLWCNIHGNDCLMLHWCRCYRKSCKISKLYLQSTWEWQLFNKLIMKITLCLKPDKTLFLDCPGVQSQGHWTNITAINVAEAIEPSMTTCNLFLVPVLVF